MHSDLRMSNIERLPRAIQALALNAVAKTRTKRDVLYFGTAMDVQPLPSHRLACLPVYFINLDLDMIPTAQQLREPLEDNPTLSRDISCAAISLDALGRLDNLGDSDVGISLWPRVWGWFQFIRMHRDYLSAIPLGPEVSLYVDLIRFIRRFHAHKETCALMSTTPHLWTCMIQAWSILPLIKDPGDRRTLLYVLSQFLSQSHARPNSGPLAEMVAAAGSVDDLARLVLDFVRTTITDPPAYPVVDLNNLLVFVVRAGGCDDDEFDLHFAPLTLALAVLEFEQELLKVILFLCKRPDDHTARVIRTCMMLIRHMVELSPPNMWLGVLLQRGLLRALILITQRTESRDSAAEKKLHQQVRGFLQEISLGLPYYHPMLAFNIALKQVEGSISRDAFKDHPLSGDWEQFLASARQFLDALDEFHSPSFFVSKACDNLQVSNSCYSIG
ncbi:hypothetical protein FB45DRAFT_1065290, partial [Roridomyces roridus]